MSSDQQPQLKRSVNLTMLVFYGLGNIFGAGIYVLIGKMAGIAGMYVPLSFIVACIVVFFTALSYAELSARYPLSAGEAVYMQEGFGKPWLSTLVGLFIAFAGMLSSATILHGFHGYLISFVAIPEILTALIMVVLLSLIAIWGIKESMAFTFVLTLFEISGLIIVIYVGLDHIQLSEVDSKALVPPLNFSVINAIILGAFLAFYAFLGFEDMVNIAEEVKEPTKTIPNAIIITLVVVTLIYIVIAFVSIAVVPSEELANSSAPLAVVYETATGSSATVLSLIALVAVINGALIQIIMVSRIFYGMSCQGWLPLFLRKVNAKTCTPIPAIIVTGGLIFILTSFLGLVTLAQFSSFFIFIVFTFVNFSLILIKRREPHVEGIKVYPMAVPVIAICLNFTLIIFQIASVI